MVLAFPILIFCFAACWAVLVVLGMRLLSGEWPDWGAPGSHGAGPVESAWLAEQATRAERRIATLAARTQRIAERLWFEGEAEIALRVRAGRGCVSLPDFYS